MSQQLNVTLPPTPFIPITLKELDQLLVLYSQEGGADNAQSMTSAPARHLTTTRRVCAHCGKSFDGKGRARFCGHSCRQKAYLKRQAKTLRALQTCPHCGERFRPVNGNQIYCCDAHRIAAFKRRKRAHPPV